MEGDYYRASNSLRSGSSSLWRNNGLDVFSRSSREEDDEEALKWAALEKLPTYDRLRKGILVSVSKGGANEIDVDNLGFQERKTLLERLVKVAEEDNEKFLMKLKNRIDRVGIEIPTIEVRYEHLNVEAEALVGSNALPSFLNFTVSIAEVLLSYLHIFPNRKRPLTILKDVSGVIKPSRMTLLLGPPSSGKTTLLLALAGKLDRNLKVSGNVTYNGHTLNEFIPQRTAAYISQHDLHIGEMTVRETLAFSARCQGVGTQHEMLAELSRREKAANIKPDPDLDVYMKAAATEGQETSVVTDYVLKVAITLDYSNIIKDPSKTIHMISYKLFNVFLSQNFSDIRIGYLRRYLVGNEMIRGISGGQRKRVTTGEMLVGPAKALFMDEISTGLDSSTTFSIVNSLRQSIHILNGTAVISLLQPAPETYNLFDDIILLSDGQIVYQGPREHVLEFFEYMGFKCPERKGVADFLQEVTSKKDQQQYWARKDQPYRFITVNEFAEAFQSYEVGRKIVEDLSTPFDRTKNHPAALAIKHYGVGKMELLKANFSREYLLMKRNSFVYIFKLFQLIMMATISMTLFLRTEMKRDDFGDAGVYLGALFFTLIMIMFNVGVWVFLTYYVIGFDPNAGRLFKQYILLLLVNQMASALFRLIASVGRNMIVANTFGSFALLTLLALGGFVLSREDIKKWWIWAYWVSPLMYGQNAIVANEFLGHSWSHIPANSNSSDSLGVQFMKSRGFFPNAYWYWLGVGALAGYILLFNLAYAVALTFLDPFEKPQAVISDEPEESTRTGGAIQLSQLESSHRTNTGCERCFQARCSHSLMGVSGAGKTTLMDVLAGRKTGGYIEGDIRISGYPKKQETFARISGYCEQNDIHSPHVTVYESLVYSAWLRLPQEVDSETRKMFVEEVMELVELNPLRQALVGLPGVNGLSTEQRKRLTIAVELVANPSIIFMDEPTSGLDARAAAIVMRTVRNTVDTGRTVVCTIHQPSIDIFEAFDELFLMKRGGEEIYVGPLGRRSCHLIKYFEGIKGVSKITDGYNPATWMLEVTSSAQELTLGVDFSDIYRNSDLYRRNKTMIQELSKPAPGTKDLYFPTQYSQPFLTQCMACLWKQSWSYWRNPPYTGVRFWFTTFIALMFGTIFWDLGSKRGKEGDLSNAMGSIEKAAGMYSAMPYAYAQALIELPYIFAQAGVYSVITYAMIGFEWTAAKFFWYLFFLYFTLLYFTFYGMMTVAVTPNHHIASIVSSAFYAIWNLFSGFIVPRTKMPVWWRWYYWACPVSWTLYGLFASQFADIKTEIGNTGQTVEQYVNDLYGIKHDFLGVSAGVIVGITLLFAFIFAISIKAFNFQRR
ncbi:hypothetical protein GH714_000045 [Hevea brasiliensis]|uniref:ABC transporter domain-containing protein n=1 Tax=Hevea brasiliensis TaxID=3981 RepID=A0A6A6N772_HEVBR|nr:hypothetical protein GH714_000045 [Hevea brasiliensis]